MAGNSAFNFGYDPSYMANSQPIINTPQAVNSAFGLGGGMDFNYGTSPMTAGVGNTGSFWDRTGSFIQNNGQTIGGLMQGIGAIGGLFNSIRGYGLAKDQFNLSKRAFETNLRNSTQSYNTALEDRIRGRSSEQSESDIQSYLSRNRLG